MAESHGGFDSIAVIPVDQIREVLRQTMVMGLPVDDLEKPTFYFKYEVEWGAHDSEGNPWDWTDAPESSAQPSPVQPVCAFEFFSPLGRQGAFPTEVGDFNPTSLVVTMFEEEFAEVSGASYATAGPGNTRFFFRFWRPSYGLGDMTVYQVHLSADAVA
jgi:hypothetical protein